MWKIYYDKGTFDSTQGDPEDAPTHGVLVIAFYDHGERRLVKGWDWYYFKDGQWWGSEIHGVVDQFMTYPRDVRALKQGRTVMDRPYQQAIDDAINDLPLQQP